MRSRRPVTLRRALVLFGVLGLVIASLLVFQPGRDTGLTPAEKQAALEKADALSLRAVTLQQSGDFLTAEQAARRALDLRQKALGPDHLDVATDLLILGSQVRDQGRNEEALSLYRQALEIAERKLAPKHPDLLLFLGAIGDVHYRASAYDAALPIQERGLRIAEQAFGAEHRDTGMWIHNLAATYWSTGRYRESLELYRRSLGVATREFGARNPNTLHTRLNLASVLHDAGELAPARKHFEQLVAIQTEELGAHHPTVALVRFNLARLLTDLGAFEEARAHHLAALESRIAAFGEKHPKVAQSLYGLGMLLKAEGRYEEARAQLERALQIETLDPGAGGRNLSTCLHGLGSVLAASGQGELARPLLEHAVRIDEETRGPTHIKVSSGLDSLGTLLVSLGQVQQALPLLMRAQELRSRVYPPTHPGIGAGLSNLAWILSRCDRHEEALTLYEQALEIAEDAYGGEHPEVATGLSNLAVALGSVGRSEEALPLLRRAVRIAEQCHGKGHPEVAGKLANLAGTLLDLERFAEADRTFAQAEEICRRELGPDDQLLLVILGNRSVLKHRMEQIEPATDLLQRCLAIVEQRLTRGLNALTAHERLLLVRSSRQYLDDWVQLMAEQGRTGYREVLRLKGLAIGAERADRRLARQASPKTAGQVIELRSTVRRLAQLARAMPDLSEEEPLRAWRAEYAVTAARRDRLARELNSRQGSERRGSELRVDSPEELKARLGADEVFVDCLRAGPYYFAWLIRPGSKVELIQLGEEESVNAAATQFCRAIVSGESGREAGKTLAELVWTPIQERLPESVRTIYLCPDAALTTVPFAALPVGDAGQCLLDRYALVHLSNANDLPSGPEGPPIGRGVLAIGGVDYGAAAPEQEVETRFLLRDGANVDRAPRGRKFEPLPETELEVASVKERLRERCTVLRSKDATELRFRDEARGRRILHLATHGFVWEDLYSGLVERERDSHTWLGFDAESRLASGHDPLDLAGLAMAGANLDPDLSSPAGDGILTASEASYLELEGVDLVVLSACRTALGNPESGEGVAGLVQGFQMAGARQVVATLWRVDDEATRLLMQHFYDGILGEGADRSAAAALRRAMLEVRRSSGRGGRSFAPPMYWAAFVCYGR